MHILWTIICVSTLLAFIFVIGMLSPALGVTLAILLFLVWQTS